MAELPDDAHEIIEEALERARGDAAHGDPHLARDARVMAILLALAQDNMPAPTLAKKEHPEHPEHPHGIPPGKAPPSSPKA